MTWLWVVMAVVADGAVALVGGLLPEGWLARYRGPMLGFATGTLLASGLGEILPGALASTGAVALAWMAAAMLVVGVTEQVSARRGHHRMEPVVPVALLGSDALHNIGDGMAIAAAFLVSIRLGVFTSAAVLLHELPEEIADYALLRAAGMTKRTALSGLAVVQLSAGIGAIGTLVAAGLIARANGPILAVAAGLFVYISAFDLVPELVRARTWSGLAAGVIGAAVVLGLS